MSVLYADKTAVLIRAVVRGVVDDSSPFATVRIRVPGGEKIMTIPAEDILMFADEADTTTEGPA